MTRLLLIGVSGIDWAALLPRLKSGVVPNLQALQQRGRAGWLAAWPPSDGPSGWATMATGRPPEVHMVHRDQEAWSAGVRATSRASWNAPPLWARLSAAGISTGGVAWPASRPGAGWDGAHLDDSVAQPTGSGGTRWALPLHCAPAPLREAVRDLRVHPTDITAAMLRPLVPELPGMDQERDTGLPRLAIAMARAATIQAGAVFLLEQQRPEALFIHQPWLGEVCAAFGESKDGPFAGVVDGAWRFLDGLIGRLAALAGADCLVMLASPGLGQKPGALIAAGPHVSPGELDGAGLLDIAPTVLAAFGLEDAALPGRALADLVAAGERRSAPSPPPAPAVAADAELMRIVTESGYGAPPPAAPEWRALGLAELAFMIVQRSPEAADELARAALAQAPGHPQALAARAIAQVALERPDELVELADALERAAPERRWGAMARGAFHVLKGEAAQARPWLQQAEAEPDPEILLNLAALWLAAHRPSDAERVFKAVLGKDPGNVSAEIGLAITASARRDFISAEEALQRALASDPGRPAVYLQLAQVYARTARYGQADQALGAARRLGASEALVDAAREGRLPG
jgi:hypothetical protein